MKTPSLVALSMIPVAVLGTGDGLAEPRGCRIEPVQVQVFVVAP
jgi:hypothetical protein